MIPFIGITLILVGSIPAAAESTVTKMVPVEKEVAILRDLPQSTNARKSVATREVIGAALAGTAIGLPVAGVIGAGPVAGAWIGGLIGALWEEREASQEIGIEKKGGAENFDKSGYNWRRGIPVTPMGAVSLRPVRNRG